MSATTERVETAGPLRIDLGCGTAKRPGFLGVDYVAAPGVDHVVDIAEDRLPFADDTVDEVFSAHFLEHIRSPNNVLSEIGRVCRDGARIEIWTPYAFSDEAFVYGHETYLTELPWLHFCVSHRDTHAPLLNGRWQLERVVYVVDPAVKAEIEATGTALGFAIRYWKGVVSEFGVEMRYRRDMDAPVVVPERVWTLARHDAERVPLETPALAPAPASSLARDVARKVVPAALRPPLGRALERTRRWARSA